jgi:flagellar M-ring protein FliF
MLDQIRRLVASLTRKQKVLTVTVALSVVSALAFIYYANREKDFRPLYTSLSAEDASQVVARLKEAAAEYRLAENGSTVLVRSSRVAELRLLVAGAGLPKTGRIGFELFDKANFGASDFAEQVNYRRALEGELERSVMALAELEQARVHLTFPKESVFTESRRPAKASVLVKLKNAATLSPQNVVAIGHLVANAVEGLTPDGVTIVDMQGNLLSRRPLTEESEGLDGNGPIEYRQRLERDLLQKIHSTLEPVLGADHFRAGVAAEVDFSAGEQSEETWDPNRSVMVSQQRSEEMNTAATPSGVPGTASSLPRPTSRPGGANSGVVRRTENIQYQSSRLVRRVKLPRGAIRRLSVTAILDQRVRWEGAGPKATRILEAPSQEELGKVRDLIAGAVGFNQERGDQIVVQTLPFEATLRSPPPPVPQAAPPPARTPASPQGLGGWLADKNLMRNPLALIAAGAGLLLLLAALFLFLRRRKKKNQAEREQQAAITAGENLPAVIGGQDADHPHATLEEKMEARLKEEQAKREKAAIEVLDSLPLPEFTSKKAEVLMKHITEQARRDPAAIAELFRTWMEEKEHP